MCKVGLELREKTGILESNGLVLLCFENEIESVVDH